MNLERVDFGKGNQKFSIFAHLRFRNDTGINVNQKLISGFLEINDLAIILSKFEK
jgi:hypothetical protein